jgi:hypothetical protein
MASTDMWTYREAGTLGVDMGPGIDVVGYSVEALDGGIGTVDEASYDVGSSYVVVDTGPWIFGKKVLLPAGVVDRVDSAEETIYVNRTKDEIKDSPEFDESTYQDGAYRSEVGGYYGLDRRGDTL